MKKTICVSAILLVSIGLSQAQTKTEAGPIKDKSLSIVGFETQMSISAGLSGKGKGVLNRVSYGPDGIQIKNPK